MKRNYYIFLLSFFLVFSVFAENSGSDTLNRIDVHGKRTGYWVVSKSNDPISLDSSNKFREGFYAAGRKKGVWINYYEDGKSPRLIGEYADNRPSGAYFRFNRNGELVQASSVPKRVSKKQSLESSNKIFKCKMYFSNREVIAGQVYFSKKVVKKETSRKFWVEKSLEVIGSEAKIIDFSWLNNNYEQLYSTYLKVRTPKSILIKTEDVARIDQASNPVVKENQNKPYYLAPTIKAPKVGKGMVFNPNGLNKLYTSDEELWIDGLFENGQLKSGKVFVYDRDGILLKVRVYKEGKYDSDGVL